MFGCCCGTPLPASCLIAATPATTLQGVHQITTAQHPSNAALWESRGRVTGTLQLAATTSIVNVVYQWSDATTYDLIRITRDGVNNRIQLITARGFEAVYTTQWVTSWGAANMPYCISWNAGIVVVVIGTVQITLNGPILNNGGKVGYRVQNLGAATITEWTRHSSEGPIGSEECARCSGEALCGCCGTLANPWLVDLTAFSLTNSNYSGCVDVAGSYVIDTRVQECLKIGGRSDKVWTYHESHDPTKTCNSVGQFNPIIGIHATWHQVEGVCTLDVTVELDYVFVNPEFAECDYQYIAKYRKQSSTFGELCSGSHVLSYIGKDPGICNGSPPGTITVSAL